MLNDKACLTISRRMADQLAADADTFKVLLANLADEENRVAALTALLAVGVKEGWARGYEAGKR